MAINFIIHHNVKQYNGNRPYKQTIHLVERKPTDTKHRTVRVHRPFFVEIAEFKPQNFSTNRKKLVINRKTQNHQGTTTADDTILTLS
ncbi:hypothetical protein C1H46_032377 [Malus baccata]|uniref:Uncharacterized protein n=1 Tax=Malus baccata TaxID=106549 RepID=A0A540L6F8_MALBA|nr:hypothetical protein C1H46_032377 [Malus baccata]